MKKTKIFLHYLLSVASVVIVPLFWRHDFLMFVILAIISILLLLLGKSKKELFLYFIFAIAGSLAEATQMSTGAWKYSHPTILGLVYWMPLVWGIAGIFVKRLCEHLKLF